MLTGTSGTVFERRPQAALLDAVDLAGELEVDLALEVDDEVGQLVGGGAQVDVAPERLVQERSDRFARCRSSSPAGSCQRRTATLVQTVPM